LEPHPIQFPPKKPLWKCTRVELNAFTGPDLIQFVADRLEEEDADASDKLIPPDEVIGEQADQRHTARARGELQEIILRLLGLDDLVARLVEETPIDPVEFGDLETALTDNPPISWRQSTDEHVDDRLGHEIVTKARQVAREALDGWCRR